MSEATAMSAIAVDGSTGSTDPGTAPGKRGGMTAAVALVPTGEPEGGIAALVVRIQQSHGEERKRLQTAALRHVQPTLKRVASRFSRKARGSLEVEDLLQIASMDALKVFDRYNHELRGSTTVEGHVAYSASRACEDQIAMHSADVHVSDDARRGRTKHGCKEELRVESRDAAPAGGYEEPLRAPSPEDELFVKQVVHLVRTLPSKQREYISRYFGLDGYGTHTRESAFRDLAQRLGVSSSSVWREIQKGLLQLRSMIDKGDRCP